MKTISRFTFIVLSFISISVFGQTSLHSPKEFLGYELGDRFTRHHEMRAYYEHVASANNNVMLIEYGKTNEHRPLFVAVISSKENIKNLEEIRIDNLKRTGLTNGSSNGNKKAIVWLSYNVHGNEASSLDASIKTLYELVNPNNKTSKEWLKNTVVIIDPCINPDGRERYVNHFYEKGNTIMNPNIDSKEHREPWPGGRANHYFFDLNRDWAWQTQVETQQRITLYNQWMPHIHVDFHEQFQNNPYYFAPAAKPYHEVITPWQREFQTTIGKNHARYFDKEGWLYFTKEVFDLLYPSYGDTYPTYNGAIGMTYEQAGHTYAGLGIITELGDTLTLKDRIEHHFTTGMSTIEITSLNAEKVVDEFANYFKQSAENPTDKYKTYIIKPGNSDLVSKLLKWLDMQQIKYESPANSASSKGFDYQKNKQASFSINSTDILISSYQPKSRLIQTLFEPKTKLEDSLTYDITAWSIPYVYGLESYATTQKIGAKAYQSIKAETQTSFEKGAYAYAVRYESMNDVAFLANMLQEGIKVRVSEKPFSSNGNKFNAGTLLVMRRNNESIKNLHKVLSELATKHGRIVSTIPSGFVEEGSDLGKNSYNYIKAPRVAVVGGPKTSSLNFGEIWHYFDREIKYPITTVFTDYFSSVDLDDYDVLIVPKISSGWFSDDLKKKLTGWVSKGGNLILIGSSILGVADSDEFSITKYANEEDKKSAEAKAKEIKKEAELNPYEDRQRDRISNALHGAIYKVSLDNTHPLAFGYSNQYFTLKTSSIKFSYLKNGGNVGVIKSDTDLYSGFVGKNLKGRFAESLVFGVESKGNGHVIYLVDNPLFRDFWENGKLLFGNAVFMFN